MKLRVSNGFLAVGVMFPLVLLFWPFAQWGTGMGLILRVIPSVFLQTLLCKTGKSLAVKLLPVVCTGLFAAWGTYLFCTSPHWSHATLGGLLADYVSPFLGCAAVCLIAALRRKV